jgi:hypothetical protein
MDYLMQCACDPHCITLLIGLDECVKKGGTVGDCAIAEITNAEAGTQAIGTGLLECVGTMKAPGACYTDCTPPAAEGGTDGGEDADAK